MAIIGQRFYTPFPFQIDINGVPLAGGQLWFYLTGTATLLDTYSDVSLTTPNENPVVADANGNFGNIWLTPTQAYKVILFTAATPDNPTGTQIAMADPVGPAAGGTFSNTVGIIGEVRDFAGPAASVPAQWLLCYGQAVSRSTYSSLFAVVGTTYGPGDSSTTFNVPDCRGRSTFGKDDMGGTPANRLTSGVSGVSGVTLGGAGGNQATQLHNHALNDPGHPHTLNDPEHDHTFSVITDGGSGSQAGGRAGAPAPDETTNPSSTGITLDPATTGITIANYGAGSSQNVAPAIVFNKMIYAGA